jgi:hypothetical protein
MGPPARRVGFSRLDGQQRVALEHLLLESRHLSMLPALRPMHDPVRQRSAVRRAAALDRAGRGHPAS